MPLLTATPNALPAPPPKADINAIARHVAPEWESTRSPRHGAAVDIPSMVAYLMSDDGAWIDGQVINVDGGTGSTLTAASSAPGFRPILGPA